MKVVVTGASGHLGPYLVAHLRALGDEVVATSRSGRALAPIFGTAAHTDATTRALDLRREAAVDALAAELGPEVGLVHLAALHPLATAATSNDDRHDLLETNVRGSMRALDAAQRAGARAVVYASSFEVYGATPAALPITEHAPTYPLTDYGATKLAGEDHLIAFAEETATRVVALRFAAIYGPGEHTPRALPNFLRAVAGQARPVVAGDGGDLRDQLHVRDAARALALALHGQAQGIFNVADAEPHSVGELARLALELAGLHGQPERGRRVKPRRDWHMSIERARRELGFVPEVSLRDGMAEQLAWLRAGAAL